MTNFEISAIIPQNKNKGHRDNVCNEKSTRSNRRN